VSGRFVASLCALAGAAVALGGCGASQVVDPVARAATVTLNASGFKVSGVMSVTGGPSPVSASLSGSVNTASNSGTMTVNESVAGKPVHAPVIYSGLNFWMKASALPGAAGRTGNKSWIYLDMSKALGAMGMSAMPSTVDPSQFLQYLGSVGATPSRVGKVSIDGVPTTEYRATINLSRYGQRYNVPAKAISSLESALGGDSLPMAAWIDSQNRVRRIHVAFPECVDGSKVQFSMTMGIFGFGAQPQVKIPSRGSVYNLTPLLATQSRAVRLGCSSSG
jgi:hypothetical protein